MSTGTTSIFRSIFRGLDERALDTLRELAELRTYPPETFLCVQGEVEHTFYVIVEGMVAISQVLDDGQERMLSILRPREYFGELGLLDDTPRMANCVTITTTTVLEITEEVFQTVLENSPAVAYSLMRHVVDLLRNTDKLAIADLMGADHLIDRSEEENWAKIIYQMTGKRGMDVVVDNVGTTFPLSFRAARKGGRILTVGNTGAPKFEIDNRYIFSKHLSIIGSTMGTLQDFATVMRLVLSGKLKVAQDRAYLRQKRRHCVCGIDPGPCAYRNVTKAAKRIKNTTPFPLV